MPRHWTSHERARVRVAVELGRLDKAAAELGRSRRACQRIAKAWGYDTEDPHAELRKLVYEAIGEGEGVFDIQADVAPYPVTVGIVRRAAARQGVNYSTSKVPGALRVRIWQD